MSAAEVFSVDDVTFVGPDGKPVSGGVPWPAQPFGTLRLWDSGTAWTNLEPQAGLWNFAPLDTWVRAAQDNGVPDIILTLGQSPAWASSDPTKVNYYGAGAPAPPRNIKDWRNYVQTVAERYKGQIRYFEIWNEPNDINYYNGSVADLVALTREAQKVLKAVDPANTVILSPPYSAGFLDLLLANGAGQYVDVIGYHAYSTPPEDTGRQLADVRLVMAAHGLSAKPLWETEGASGDLTTSDTDAPAYLTRKFLTDLAFGAGRFDWYTWGPATPFCVATTLPDRTLSPAGKAYGYVQAWLNGSILNDATIDSSGNWQIGLTLADGNEGLIVWNPAGNFRFVIPDSIQVFEKEDIFGNTVPWSGKKVIVSGAPLLLVGH